MRIRTLLQLFACLFFFTQASATTVPASIPSYCSPGDTTIASLTYLPSPPKLKKDGFFKRIGKKILGFIVKTQFPTLEAKGTSNPHGYISLGFLAAAIIAAVTAGPGRHAAISAGALLAFGFFVLALIFLIVYLIKKRKIKKAANK